MSMAEDYDLGYGYDDFYPSTTFEQLIWTTKEGKTILICHMDDEHLINTVRYLKRKDMIVPYQMEMEIVHRNLKELI